MIRKVFWLVIFFTLLSGCAVKIDAIKREIVAPSAASLSDADAAILMVDFSLDRGGLGSLIRSVDDADGTLVGPGEYLRVKVAPGKYTVMLYALNRSSYAFPFKSVYAEAGKTYVFFSSVIMDGQAVKADYMEVPTESYWPQK